MVEVTMKMPQALKDSLPRTEKGGVDWDWVRETLRESAAGMGGKNVALLQVPAHESGWIVVSVHETKELAEIEGKRAGYPVWSVSEFGVRGK